MPLALHQFAFADQGGERESIGQRFAEGRHIGNDVVRLLGSAIVPAKTGDHLVQHKHGTVSPADLLHTMQEMVLRIFVFSRLQNDAGNLVGVGLK